MCSRKEFCVSSYDIQGRSAGWLAEAITEVRKEAKEKEDFKKKADSLEGKGVEFFKFLLGDKLVSKNGEVDTKSVVEGKVKRGSTAPSIILLNSSILHSVL